MNKNYKRGMKDGATPFEDKFKKQEEKFRQTEGELRQEQSKLDSFLDDLLDVSEEQDKRITNIEDKANYGFNDVIDIKDLEDKDKKFLAGILMATCKRIKKINQQQKDFILGVLKYIDIKKPDLNISLENIENIESIQIQKAMLQVIMELMFIGEENFDFLNEYEDIFDYFSVNKKGFKDIKKSIQDMYDMVGIEGLYYKDEEELLVEDVVKENQEKEEEIEQEEIVIGKDFVIDDFETKEFKNKKVIINDNIEYTGILKFINSEIEFNKSIEFCGKLEFDSCKIILTKVEEPSDSSYFNRVSCIKTKEYKKDYYGFGFKTGSKNKSKMKLVIKNCYITEKDNKIYTKYEQAKILINEDCSVEIISSKIEGVENFLEFYVYGDNEDDYTNLFLEDNNFTNTQGYVINIRNGIGKTIINNCTFCNNEDDIIKAYNEKKSTSILKLVSIQGIITNSNFYNISKNCINSKYFESNVKNLTIEKCNFSNFLGGIDIYGVVNIQDCNFKNISNEYKKFLKDNDTIKNRCITIRGLAYTEGSKIENCIFENCGIEEEALKYDGLFKRGTFIKEHYTKYFAEVINCQFKNNLLHKEYKEEILSNKELE